MFESLRLCDFPDKHRAVLRHSSSTRPMIRVVEENGVRAVVKDFSVNGFLYRNVAGRFLVWREEKAYRRLKNVKGVPALYRVIDGLALVMEEIPGRSLENLEKEIQLDSEFFHALKRLVDKFHERGLAHCDLKRAPNFILGQDGQPYVIDWAASISESEFSFFPLNRIYRRFLLDDYLAIIKLKLRHIPKEVTPEEKSAYNKRGGMEIVVRSIRDRLRNLLQKIA